MIGGQAAETIETSAVDIESATVTVLSSNYLPVSGVFKTNFEGSKSITTHLCGT